MITATKLFTIPRSEGYEEILDPLVIRITGAEQSKHHTGCNFENDTFAIRVHYFGPCTCGYQKDLSEYLKTNPHKPDCFHTELLVLNEAFKKHDKYFGSNRLRAARANEERKLCLAHRIDYNSGKSLGEVCTCGAIDSFNSTQEGLHQPNCKKNLPNFHFKKDDVQISWYKTYFRDAFCNCELTKEKLQNIIGWCVASLRQ